MKGVSSRRRFAKDIENRTLFYVYLKSAYPGTEPAFWGSNAQWELSNVYIEDVTDAAVIWKGQDGEAVSVPISDHILISRK